MYGSRDMTLQPPIPMRNLVAVVIWAEARTLLEGVNAMLHSTMAQLDTLRSSQRTVPRTTVPRTIVPHTILSLTIFSSLHILVRCINDVSGYSASITVYFYFCLHPIPGISMFCRLLCRYLLIFCTPWVMATIKYLHIPITYDSSDDMI